MQSLVRILIVENVDFFQGLIAPILNQRPNWRVAGVVADEAGAVRLARLLQPDLILLDIDLPRMNGVKTARHIRMLAPNSRIVFLSHESSLGVVRQAFRLGAWAYVTKEHAAPELIAAVEAVLQGKQFIASGVSGHDNTASIEDPDRRLEQILAPSVSPLPQKVRMVPSHKVQFYSRDTILLERATRFVEVALRANHSVIFCTTGPRREGIFHALKTQGLDIESAVARGSCITLDAGKILSTVMVENLPDPTKFLELFGGFITSAADAARGRHSRVVLYEECAPLLWEQGKEEATLRVEVLCNELVTRYDVDIFCGYSVTYFHGEEDRHLTERICALHTAVDSR